AQDLVARDHVFERPSQRVRRERPAHCEGRGHVVASAPRLELLEEPHPLLRERERERASARTTRNGRRRRAPAGIGLAPRREEELADRRLVRRELGDQLAREHSARREDAEVLPLEANLRAERPQAKEGLEGSQRRTSSTSSAASASVARTLAATEAAT